MAATKTRRPPTLAKFKAWARTNEPVAKAVLMARAFAQLERERVSAYTRPIFDSYHFGCDPEHLYTIDDEVMVACYFADCDDAHRAHGFTGPKGHCPALVAENLVMEAERLLIGLATPLFGIESNQLFGDKRVEYLKILIGACLAGRND